jgi:predicted oxidoreductase
MFRFLSFVLLLCLAEALVPQVPLCDQEGCPSVSRIGLGTLHLGDRISGLTDAAEVNAWLQNGLAQGITLIDTADVYPVKGGNAGDSAKLLGEALALTPGLREKFTIVAKMDIIFPNKIDTSREHLTETLDWFLTSLKTSYVDVVLLHYPNSFMNAAEVAATFSDFKEAGKVKHFGTSNHYPAHRDTLQKYLTPLNITLVTNEIEVSAWNPSYLNYDSNLVDDSVNKGYRVLAWSAMGGDPIGGLNRLFVRKGTRQLKINHAIKKAGDDLGEEEGGVVALAWVLAHPSGIIPLIGTTKNSRVNALAGRALDLSAKFNTDTWWEIGGAGGLCALADSQCNYEEYMAKDIPDF